MPQLHPWLRHRNLFPHQGPQNPQVVKREAERYAETGILRGIPALSGLGCDRLPQDPRVTRVKP